MTKLFFALFLCSLLAPSAPAAQGKIDLKPKTEAVVDPGSATPLLYKKPSEVPSLPSPGKRTRATTTCTDSGGIMVKQGDAGFDACLRNLDKSQLQKNSETHPNSVGITFGN